MKASKEKDNDNKRVLWTLLLARMVKREVKLFERNVRTTNLICIYVPKIQLCALERGLGNHLLYESETPFSFQQTLKPLMKDAHHT